MDRFSKIPCNIVKTNVRVNTIENVNDYRRMFRSGMRQPPRGVVINGVYIRKRAGELPIDKSKLVKTINKPDKKVKFVSPSERYIAQCKEIMNLDIKNKLIFCGINI